MGKNVPPPTGGELKAGCFGLLGLAAFAGVWNVTSFWFAVVALAVLFVGSAIAIGQHRAKRERIEAEQRRALEEADYERQRAQDAERLADLILRFGEETAERIVAGEYWQGATADMMWESLGPPDDVKEKVYKSKTRETRCYHQTGANRYELRVHFENGIVVGWEN